MGTGKTYTPGSGIVTIINSSGLSASSASKLNIVYSVRNVFPNDAGVVDKYIVDLISPQHKPHYTFRSDSSISNIQALKGCIAKAIKDWVCLTGVNFEMGQDTSFNDTTLNTTININDEISHIYLDTIKNSNAIARTYQRYLTLRNQCNSAWAVETDIIINQRFLSILQIDTILTNSISAGYYDFYHVILHELGHAHSLQHINDSTAVMYFKGDLNGIPANQRAIRLYNDSSAYLGGYYIIRHSEMFDTSWCGIGNGRLISDTSGNCIGSPLSTYMKEKPNIYHEFYPNPTSDYLNFICTFSKTSDIDISIYDYTGRILYRNLQLKQSEGIYKSRINISGFSNGFYFVDATVNKYKYTCKFIKQ